LRQLGRNYSLHYRPSKQVYDIKTSDKNNLRVVTKIVQEQYNDFVYDLSVEKNNNFVDACGQVLLHNTDSNFLKMVGKTKKDVEEFAEKVNKSLPEGMELEVDGFYKRGLFVTKKEGGAAKKRYALLGENGQLKIVGFEYVRRDWCELAKETQRKVIELVLEKGTPDAAGEYVQKILEYINQGKAKKSELAIMTMLQRDPSDYDSKGPHVVAAEKAIARGKELGAGSMLSFIVTKATKKTKSVSDKAELEEYVEEGNYDPEYYIENQVLPAVLKILQELGYSREDLLKTGKQSGLAAWS
jgi:DNA polymerase I